MKKTYKTICKNLQVLKWESKVETPPTLENWWTFDPEENDLALVDNTEYIFKNNAWQINKEDK